MAALGGCGLLDSGPFVDFEAFDPLPAVAALDLTEGLAEKGVSYWELRIDGITQEVVTGGGVVARSEIDPDVLAAFDTTRVVDGFGQLCPPGDCFYYLAGLAEGLEPRAWGSLDAIQPLMAPVESPSEAAILALAAGYAWSDELVEGAVRRVGDDWHLVVTRRVSFCDPIEDERVLLAVARDGTLEILKRETLRSAGGVCI